MLFAPESQQIPESTQITDPFASEIEDLRTIARMHNFASGSPDRLAVLPMRLSQDARLRSDITEFIRSLQTRDRTLALPEVLSLVLAAIGGSSALHRNRDLAEPIDLTGGFLASLGGWPGSAVEPLTDIDNPPDHDPRLDLAAAAHTETLQADLSGRIDPNGLTSQTAPALEIEDKSGRDPDGTVSLAEITQALARLERGNLELRLHLDSIDQRICRMEPLLETSSAAAPPDPQPDPPSPPAHARAPFAASAEAPLIHRGSESSSTSPDRRGSLGGPQDTLDVLKEQRRISLTSNFPELPPSASRNGGEMPAASDPAPRPEAPVAVSPVPKAALADPVSHPRTHPPRRDRFAAAREIPGTAAEFDPLYSAPEADLPSRSTSQQTAEPAAVEVKGWNTHRVELQAQTAAVPFASSLETPAAFPALSTPESLPSGPEPHQPSQPIARAPLQDTASAPRLNQPASLHPSAAAEPPQRRRSPWIGGIAAAAILGAAGFLYINGLPSVITEWVSGSSSALSSNSLPDSSPAASTDPARSVDPHTSPSSSHTSASSSASAAPGRVLGARDSFTPTQSVERVSGPTFVPGGIMDGYLVAAPRPEYPRLANLAGVNGKISMEAMISKEGQVEALKVLGGPQLLRDAATTAVKQWQYRPFEVKGRPVEVRTIIRVDVASRAGSSPTE